LAIIVLARTIDDEAPLRLRDVTAFNAGLPAVGAVVAAVLEAIG
jgi:hypothetical protein